MEDDAYIQNLIKRIREGKFTLPDSNKYHRITMKDVLDNIRTSRKKEDDFVKTKLIEYIVRNTYERLRLIRTHPDFVKIFEETLYWEFI